MVLEVQALRCARLVQQEALAERAAQLAHELPLLVGFDADSDNRQVCLPVPARSSPATIARFSMSLLEVLYEGADRS